MNVSSSVYSGNCCSIEAIVVVGLDCGRHFVQNRLYCCELFLLFRLFCFHSYILFREFTLYVAFCLFLHLLHLSLLVICPSYFLLERDLVLAAGPSRISLMAAADVGVGALLLIFLLGAATVGAELLGVA